jgi:hypothetical protein
MESIYGENWQSMMVVSLFLTWGIGLAPPLLMRFAIFRRPIEKWWAIGTVGFFWVFNIVLFMALGSQSKSHGAVALIAFASYYILRTGAKKKQPLNEKIIATKSDKAFSLPQLDNKKVEKNRTHQNIAPTKTVMPPASNSSPGDVETRKLKRQLEEWATTSDTELAVQLASSDYQVTNVAMDHLEKAAAQGKHQACYLIGEIYRIGSSGYSRNNRRAVYWLKKAQKMGHTDAAKMLEKLDMQEAQMANPSTDDNVENDPTPVISNAPENDGGWSEDFKILNEYDVAVKECHDELESLDPQLSSQFREEVVSDRKNAAKIKDRLKAEHEMQMSPYKSGAVNEALATARELGSAAEKEFTRVVEVMGEDIEVESILQRLKEKYGVLVPPDDLDIDAQMEYWGIVKTGDRFVLGEFQYAVMRDAIAFGQKKLDEFFKNANSEDYKVILTSCGYNLERISQFEFRVSPKLGQGFEGPSITIAHELLPNYIKEKFSPKEIRHHVNFLLWSFDE